MSDERFRAAGSPPRALAELPVETLLAGAEELTKEWVIALIAARPLVELGELALEDLARDAPALLAQAIRAIGADRELEGLTAPLPLSRRGHPAAARSLAAICAARDAAGTVRAVEALRSVLWHGMLLDRRWQVTGSAATRQLSDLAERVAFVCASILTAALEEGTEPSVQATPADPAPERAGRGGPGVGVRSTPAGAVLVDERAEPVSAPALEESRAGAERAPQRPSSWDASPPLAPGFEREVTPDAWEQRPRGASAGDEIAIRDARHEEGPAAWIGSIGRQLELAREDRRPFAVLLVEPREIEHMRAGEPASEIQRMGQELEDALALAFGVPRAGSREEVSLGRGSLTRERPGRYWLLSPETDRAGAISLVERLRRAVASVVEHRGEPVELVIGTAICPEDGHTPAALAAHADVSLYAARSAARAARGPHVAARDH
ncbi:MAG TPA: hypothetical protein VII03_05030 [Solirubrobacteraceae bacterium]